MSKRYRCVNGLDRVDGDFVRFFATEEEDLPTITLFVENGFVKVSSSMKLPTRNWLDHAFAIGRAREFVRDNNLQEAQREVA